MNDFHGWVVNGVGEIWYTGDGGESWKLQFNTGHSNRSVTFATPLHGWVGTLNWFDRLYQTTDAGATRNPVPELPPQMPFGICGMWAVDDQVVYAVGK